MPSNTQREEIIDWLIDKYYYSNTAYVFDCPHDTEIVCDTIETFLKDHGLQVAYNTDVQPMKMLFITFPNHNNQPDCTGLGHNKTEAYMDTFYKFFGLMRRDCHVKLPR